MLLFGKNINKCGVERTLKQMSVFKDGEEHEEILHNRVFDRDFLKKWQP